MLDRSPGAAVPDRTNRGVATNTRSSTQRAGTSRSRDRGPGTNSTPAPRDDIDGAVIDGSHGALLLGEELLPPGGVSVEQAQLLLGLLVVGHLVLELAALLGEGAGAVVDPLVAVDLVAPAGGGGRGVGPDDGGGRGGGDDGGASCGVAVAGDLLLGGAGDDGVDAGLFWVGGGLC